MKKPFSNVQQHKRERILLLWIPSIAIILALMTLIPQLLMFFFPPDEEYHPPAEAYITPDLLPEDELTAADPENAADPANTEDVASALSEGDALVTANGQIASEMLSANRWVTGEDGSRSYRYVDGTFAQGLTYIDNQVYYFDENGRCASHVGVDVSFYNGNVDWQAVRNAGFDFAVVRVGGRGWGSGGTLYDDSFFFSYLNNAQAAGLRTGVYFYSAAANTEEAKLEAQRTLDELNGFQLELPVFFDTELSGNYPGGRADELSMAQRVEITKAFCETIEEGGYQAGIYTSESFLTDELNYSAVSAYPIWMASYTEDNALPRFSGYDIWQLTDQGRVPGISGSCDVNVIF